MCSRYDWRRTAASTSRSTPGHNTALLVMDGAVDINGGRRAQANDFVLFGHAGRDIAIESGAGGAHVMVLSGTPIDEPVAQYGPFVMNTERELRQAISNFNRGLFGQLPE